MSEKEHKCCGGHGGHEGCCGGHNHEGHEGCCGMIKEQLLPRR